MSGSECDIDMPESASDFDEIDKALDEETGTVHVRYSVRVASDNANSKEWKLLSKLATTLPNGSPPTQRRLQILAQAFADSHAWPNGPGKGQFHRKERIQKALLARCKYYIYLRVLASAKKDKRTGQPILNKKGEQQYMSFPTLLSLAQDFGRLLAFFPVPRLSSAAIDDAKAELQKYCQVLRQRYALMTPKRERSTLYPTDVRAIIERHLEEAQETKRYDIAVQSCAMMATFMYTGARTGSILSTDHYPEEYLTWEASTALPKKIRFRPSRDHIGNLLGFDILIDLDNWKGYHDGGDSLSISIQVKTTKSERWVLLDLGNWLIAHGLRLGVFGEATLDDLRARTSLEFRCDTEFDETPVFLARLSRTTLKVDEREPMNGNQANLILQDMLLAAGISIGGSFSETLYALRRGFATNMSQALSRDIARFFLGHTPNSTILERHYDMTLQELNVGPSILGTEEAEIEVATPLSLMRVEGSTNSTKVTLKDALEQSPEYRNLVIKRDLLLTCSRSGSGAWRKVEPYTRLIAAGTNLSQSMLPILVARLECRMRTIIDAMRNDAYDNESERQRVAREAVDLQTIRARREEAEKPSALAQSLIKAILEKEEQVVNGVEGVVLGIKPTVIIEALTDEDDFDLQDGGRPELSETESRAVAGASGPVDVSGEESGADVEEAEGALVLDDQMSHGLTGSAGTGTMSGQEALSVPEQKAALLNALVDFEDVKVSRRCDQCHEDSTISPALKAKVWKHATVAKKLHDLFTHSSYPRINRWMTAHVINNRFICPFEAEPANPQGLAALPSPCGFSCSFVDKYRIVVPHLWTTHRAMFEPDLLFALDPSTRPLAKGWATAEAERLQLRKRTVPKALKYDARVSWPFLLPGTWQPEDIAVPFLARLGLGPSLSRFGQVSGDTDMVPEGLWGDGSWLDC